MLKQNNQRKGTTVDEGKRKLFYRGQPDLYIRVEATRYCGLLLYLPSYKPQNRCSISVTADDSKGMWYRKADTVDKAINTLIGKGLLTKRHQMRFDGGNASNMYTLSEIGDAVIRYEGC